MSNLTDLLEKASILLTPTAYSNGDLHSVKPVRTFGSELITNGDFATDSDWTKGTGWTISGGTANQDGSNGILRQNNVSSTNTKLKVTFDLTNFGGSGNLNLKLAPNQYPITLNGNGSYTVFTDGTNSTNGDLQIITSSGFVGSIDNVSAKEVIDADFNFTRGTIATRVNEQGLIEDVTDTNLPRIDYLGGTGHLLLEPQSTNTATYSNDFTQGDIFNSSANPAAEVAVLTSQQATSPDGTNNAWLIKDDNSGGTGTPNLRFFIVNVTSNDFNTVAIFVKKALTNNFIVLSSISFDSSANGNTWFNISNGTLGNVDSDHTAKIEDYGNGWYRCQITFKATTDTTGVIRIRLADTNGSSTVPLDGTNGLYLFGLQCEADATRNFATSYIPTSGSTVTRNEDVCNNSGSSDLMNGGSGGEGVFYVELAALTKTPGVMSITLSDNSQTERIVISTSSTENQIISSVNNGSAIPNHIALPTVTDLTAFNKIAIKHKLNDLSLYINGSEEATDTSVTIPDLSSLQFDNGFNGTSKFFGKIKCVAVYKESLTDAQLTALTT